MIWTLLLLSVSNCYSFHSNVIDFSSQLISLRTHNINLFHAFLIVFFCYLRGKSVEVGKKNCNALDVSYGEQEFPIFYSAFQMWLSISEPKKQKLEESRHITELVFALFPGDQLLSLEQFLHSYRAVRSVLNSNKLLFNDSIEEL